MPEQRITPEEEKIAQEAFARGEDPVGAIQAAREKGTKAEKQAEPSETDAGDESVEAPASASAPPEASPEERAKPGSLESLPDDLRAELQKLEEPAQQLFLGIVKERDQSRFSHQERRKELQQLREENRRLMDERSQYADQLIRTLGISRQSDGEVPEAKPKVPDRLAIEFDEQEGSHFLPIDRAREVASDVLRSELSQRDKAAAIEAQRRQLTSRLIEQVKVPEEKQELIRRAHRLLSERAEDVFRRYGRQPQSFSDILAAYEHAGIASELEEIAPGVDMADVLELDFAATDPFNHGRAIPRILSRYAESAEPAQKREDAGTPAEELRTPPPTKPTSLAKRGTSRGSASRPLSDRLAQMSGEELMRIGTDPGRFEKLKKDIEEEYGITIGR